MNTKVQGMKKSRLRLGYGAGQAVADIYAFIFALLLSNALMGSPMIGGTFFLCGSIGSIIFGNKEAKSFLSKRQVCFNIVLYCALLVIDLLLIFYYPYDVQTNHVWTVFAVQMTVFVSDFLVRAMDYRSLARGMKRYWAYILLQGFLALAGACILFFACPDNRILSCGYLVMFCIHEYEHLKDLNLRTRVETDAIIASRDKYRQGYAYRLYEMASVFVLMAACITVILVYCSISLTSKQIVVAMVIAFLCMTLSAISARLYMNRMRSRNRLETSSLVLWGLVFWMAGMFIYCQNSVSPMHILWKRFAGMALCSYGISITLFCLEDFNKTLQLSTGLYATQDADAYRAINQSRNNTVVLVSELSTLLFMTFSLALSRKSYIENIEFADHLQPFLLIPASILILAAFATLLIFPINNRYTHKLGRLMDIEAEGINNQALHDQVESVFVQKRKRPVGTNLIKIILRPFFRHKLIDKEKIVEDETNPIVYLCNHSEVYGPLASMINLPGSVRPWVISDIVIDPEEFAVYFNRYTLSQIKWIPDAWKMKIARLFGKVSVWGMNQLDSIPVYRNKPAKLIVTLRQTIAAMEAGDNILIFPENPNADPEHPGYVTEGVGPLFEGFVLLADAYYRKTKKACRFLPVFASKDTWTISIGDEILYNPEANGAVERDRISREASLQMQAMYLRQKQAKNHENSKQKKTGAS